MFVLFLHVCGDQDLAAHMHILCKCWGLVVIHVGGEETVEKGVIGCSYPSRGNLIRFWVAHNLCGARSTLISGTSPTGWPSRQIFECSWVKGVGFGKLVVKSQCYNRSYLFLALRVIKLMSISSLYLGSLG